MKSNKERERGSGALRFHIRLVEIAGNEPSGYGHGAIAMNYSAMLTGHVRMQRQAP